MSSEELRVLFRRLGVWERDGERAPHKPLLLLLALGRYLSGGSRLIPYAEVDERLKDLLGEFGPVRRTIHTEYPFWYLQTDGMWEVVGAEHATVRQGKARQPTKRSLMQHGAVGGLVPDAFEGVTSDRRLARDLIEELLVAHFPETVHGDILERVGLELGLTGPVSCDPKFRESVMLAYDSQCAVCGYDGRLSGMLAGLDAAHIRWRQAHGPSQVQNGMALCALHHRLFDRGAFTVTLRGVLEVSQHFGENSAEPSALMRHHARDVALPRDPSLHPAPSFLAWHRREVFRAPGRWMG